MSMSKASCSSHPVMAWLRKAVEPGAPVQARGDESQLVVLRDGASVRVRSLSHADEQALRAAFRALSPWSRYQRFMGHVSDLSDGMWRYLCRVDGRDHVALVALHRGDRIVGVARFIRESTDPSTAELAVTIADDWQRRGLGLRLVALLADVALDVGVTTFLVHSLQGNVGICRLIAKIGDVIEAETADGGRILRLRLRASTAVRGG